MQMFFKQYLYTLSKKFQVNDKIMQLFRDVAKIKNQSSFYLAQQSLYNIYKQLPITNKKYKSMIMIKKMICSYYARLNNDDFNIKLTVDNINHLKRSFKEKIASDLNTKPQNLWQNNINNMFSLLEILINEFTGLYQTTLRKYDLLHQQAGVTFNKEDLIIYCLNKEKLFSDINKNDVLSSALLSVDLSVM